MRFTNILVALGSVASVVSAFQGVSDGSRNLDITNDNLNSYHDAETTLVPVRLDARAGTKGAKKGGKNGGKKGGKKTDTSSDAVTDSACSIKKSPRLRFMPRNSNFNKLKSSPNKPGQDGSYNLLENEWVTAASLKSGDKVSVTSVTGCSAVFLWNKDNVPSVFHIFCDAGAKEAPVMAAEVAEMGLKTEPVFVTIAARNTVEFNKIKDAILEEFGKDCDRQGLEKKDFDPVIYNNEVPDGRLATGAWRFDAVAGTRKVTQSKGPKVSVQARSFSSYF